MDSYRIDRISQPQAEALLKGTRTAIISTGSIEQHGAHLPLGTDAIAALTIAERVAARLESVLVPMSVLGVAPYHMAWAGSLTLKSDTMRAMIRDVCSGLARGGAERILIVNWHEGNTPTVRLAADDVQSENDVRVVIAEGHIITNGLYPDEMEFTHAGAMETAAVLAYDPSLVQQDEARNASDIDVGDKGHALYRQRDVFPILEDFREVAPTGWYGHPDRITVERAREILDEVADVVAAKATAAFDELDERAKRFDKNAPASQ